MAGTANYVLWLVVAIAGVLVVTKMLGAMFSRLGQSASLGEIIAGVVLGGAGLRLLDAHDPIIHALSQAGVIVLLFSAGLHTDPAALIRPGSGSRSVALVGVAVPFLLGAGATSFLGGTWIESLIAGAALGATSIHVSARTLGKLGLLESGEGQMVQGAAVLDDAISLAIIAVVMGLVTSSASTAELIVRSLLVPSAFIAGLLVDAKGMSGRVERVTSSLYAVVAPFFFAVTGALIDVRALVQGRTLLLAAALFLVGAAGKIAAGWGPRRFDGNRLVVGVAMIPRGALGLIVAHLGFAAGAIESALYAAIVLLVFVTTLVTPPLLTLVARPQRA